MADQKAICAWCYYARMRRNICGIYCTGGFTNADGTCDHFKDYLEMKKQKKEKHHVSDHQNACSAGSAAGFG